MNTKEFFDYVRKELFGNKIKSGQVEGIVAILYEWGKYPDIDPKSLAYMLATVYHETAKTMQPIEEWKKGMNKKYGIPDSETGQKYYGRGLVQLTWKANYQRASVETGEDLVNKPQLACKLPIAIEILFKGMTQGWFTGKDLKDYFGETKTDWINARKIINGLDKAELIAGYAKQFYEAVKLL